MTSLFRPRLIAAFVACLALAAPAQAQFDPFHRQAAAGRRSGRPERGRGTGGAHQPARGGASPGQRPDRGTGERPASARGAAAEIPPGRRIPVRRSLRGAPRRSRTSPKRPRPERARRRPPRPRKSDAFDPNADPNAPGAPRPLGTDAAERAARARNAGRRGSAAGARQARRSNSARRRRRRADRRSSAPGWRCSISRASSSTPRLQAFQAGQYPEAEAGFKAFLAANPAHRLSAGRDLLYRRDLSSALAPARGGRAISQGHDRLFQVVAGAGEHGAARTDARRARQHRTGLRDADANSASATRPRRPR